MGQRRQPAFSCTAQQLMPAGAIDKPLEDENPANGTMCGPVWVKHPSLVEHFTVLCTVQDYAAAYPAHVDKLSELIPSPEIP